MKKNELFIKVIEYRIIELMTEKEKFDRCDDSYDRDQLDYDIKLYCETYFTLTNIEDEEEQRIKYNEFVDIAEQLAEYKGY